VDFLVSEARAGCFGAVSPNALAQALLSTDEPRIITFSGSPSSAGALWPVDEILEELIMKGESAVAEALRALAAVDMPPGYCLMAAEAETYSRKHDVALHLAIGWGMDGIAVATRNNLTTFNGRAHLMYSTHGYEPRQSQDNGWLTFRAGGLGMFIHGGMTVAPARIWRRFGWEPSATNPLIWTKDGRIIVRCELIRGPIRDSIHDSLHRQPVLLRWIVDEKEFENVKGFLAAYVTESARVEVKTVK
jgi:hypothetical protein